MADRPAAQQRRLAVPSQDLAWGGITAIHFGITDKCENSGEIGLEPGI
jgi:hypothetical protein